MKTTAHTALGRFNHWRAQAARLPLPTMEGERCISPADVVFQAYVVRDEYGRKLIGWELCGRAWSGTGVLFCEREIA